MLKKILVVTATPGFGELIQQTLTETGTFRVSLVASAAEALGRVQESDYVLAILDGDLEDLPFRDFIFALHRVAPGLNLVLIPPEHEPDGAPLDHPAVKGALSKPFYLPDLLDLLERILGPIAKPPPNPRLTPVHRETGTGDSPPPTWLEDVSRAAQHLTALLLGTAAQAALIVRSQQLWAYAGQLPQPAAQELAAQVASYWEQERGLPAGAWRGITSSDLTRFVRLGSNGGEYMLYATRLNEKMVLALAFDAETPFSKIRSQAGQLARALANPMPVIPQISRVAPPTPTSTDPSLTPTRPASQSRNEPVRAIPDLSDDWIKMDKLAEELASEDGDQENQDSKIVQPDLLHANLQTSHGQPQPLNQPLTGEYAAPQIVLEPASPSVINLVYACVIIPRLPQHQLAGDLVGRLVEWIGQFCLAFGWRLENISIYPGYVQWVVNVPPTTSPSYLMRILRQHTSKRIFAEFPALAQDNPSGDFWAPGYLIMSSPTPPPNSIIQDFIQQIRRHQGASNPFMPQFER